MSGSWAPETASRLDFIAGLALNRPLKPADRADLAGSAAAFRAHFQARPADANALLAVGNSPADPALNPIELAGWMMVASQFLNLDEFLTK